MKLLRCPLNGLRNISEFLYGGEVHPLTDPSHQDSRAWAEQVFFDDNAAGVVLEWRGHRPTSFWFIAERDTLTDQVLRTFASSEIYGERAGPHKGSGRQPCATPRTND